MNTATRYKVIDTALCIGDSVFEGEVVVVLAAEYDHDTNELREDRDSQQRACIHWIRQAEELRAQVEALREALASAAVAMWNSEANMDNEAASAEEALADSALQCPAP